jgi:hypothetical protein
MKTTYKELVETAKNQRYFENLYLAGDAGRLWPEEQKAYETAHLYWSYELEKQAKQLQYNIDWLFAEMEMEGII